MEKERLYNFRKHDVEVKPLCHGIYICANDVLEHPDALCHRIDRMHIVRINRSEAEECSQCPHAAICITSTV